MKNGEIIAHGDHRSLLQTNELYASMINASIDSFIDKKYFQLLFYELLIIIYLNCFCN